MDAPQSAVTALRFNASGALLASGAKDTDVILWDVVGEAGLFRLRGHHDQARHPEEVLKTAQSRLLRA